MVSVHSSSSSSSSSSRSSCSSCSCSSSSLSAALGNLHTKRAFPPIRKVFRVQHDNRLAPTDLSRSPIHQKKSAIWHHIDSKTHGCRCIWNPWSEVVALQFFCERVNLRDVIATLIQLNHPLALSALLKARGCRGCHE